MKIAGCDLSISSSGIVVEDLEDDFTVKSINYYGFTQKKKLESENILLYSNKNFTCDYQKYIWMVDKILEWVKDCEYIAVEDYAMHAGAMGMIFNLAEFEGLVKINCFKEGKNIRLYSINGIKKFFSGFGLSDKIGMKNAFDNTYQFQPNMKPDLSDLPDVVTGHGVSPTSDIVDATAICEMLRTELQLRHNVLTKEQLPKHQQESLYVSTKDTPNGYINKDFIHR